MASNLTAGSAGVVKISRLKKDKKLMTVLGARL